jgi:hypothetical protein
MTATPIISVRGVSSVVCAPKESLQPARWAAQPARLARMDRLCALGLVAVDGALLDAGLPDGTWNGERTAIAFGTAYGCHATNEEYYRGLLAQGAAGASPRLFAYTLPSSPAGEISIHYGVRGPATTLAPGLTAGLAAVVDGVRQIAAGRADRVLVAAAEVATPLLSQLVGAELNDGAAALVLEAGDGGTGRIVACAESFVAGRPEEAAARVRAALGGEPIALVEPGTLGAAPLITLARARGGVVIATDPAGAAVGVRAR